jgi:hypothetical protein
MVALTRLFLHQGKVYRAAHIVDFLVHPSVRGMASLFQLIAGLKELSGFDFLLIMAPNAAGAAVWEKFVKMRGYFNLDVAVAPIRPMALLESRGKIHAGAFGRALDFPWRLLLGGATRLGSLLSHTEIESRWPEREEIEQMLAVAGDNRVAGLRSAEFLDWRYRQSPVFHYEVSFLRVKRKLAGYFVTRRTVYDGIDCLFIVDAFGDPALTAGAWRAASQLAISRASHEGAEMAMILGNTAWGALSTVSGMPYLTVPPRYLPRKTTVYAQWITEPGFEITRDNFYVALGDSDVI